MKTIVLSASLAFALTACGIAERKERVDEAVAGAKSDNVSMALDATTRNMAVNVPGFSGNIKIPGSTMNISDFDIDGVKLYPGSTVGSMNVDAKDGTANVRVGFVSPADVAAVRDHLAKGFAGKNIAVSGDANGLAGTNADGDRFFISLAPDGAGKTRGLATIVDTKK